MPLGHHPKVTTSPPRASVSPLPAAVLAGCRLRHRSKSQTHAVCPHFPSISPNAGGITQDLCGKVPPEDTRHQDASVCQPISFQDC